VLRSTVFSLLNSHTIGLATADCDQSIVKTKITNEINNESQNVEGADATDAIIGVEINKSLKYVVSSLKMPNQTTTVTAETYNACKRIALKSVLCENTIKLK